MRDSMTAPTRMDAMVAPLGGCTRETLRCADARLYDAVLRPCCREHVRRIVADTVALLVEYEVTYGADYGTLLGAVRNPMTTKADYSWLPQDQLPDGPLAPGIVPHDKDADFFVMLTDWPKLMRVRAGLERKGYVTQVNPYGAKMKVRLSQVNHTNLDLFCWRQKPDGGYLRPRYATVDLNKGRDIPPGMLLPLTQVEWEGMTLPAPTNPEAFCAFRYGPTWKTPIAANFDKRYKG